LFRPQHHTPPFAATAHDDIAPAAIRDALTHAPHDPEAEASGAGGGSLQLGIEQPVITKTTATQP
jgi:hypothetical protein